jgi:hypothetical protein
MVKIYFWNLFVNGCGKEENGIPSAFLNPPEPLRPSVERQRLQKRSQITQST